MVILRASCVSVLLLLSAMSLHAQNANAGGPVQVIIFDHEMVNDLARDLHVETSQIPPAVQVEVQIATGVCGVAKSQLETKDANDLASCDATTSSPAFEHAVGLQLLEH
jgi:hypothetical protein